MTGKVKSWIFAEEYYQDGLMVDYIEFDGRHARKFNYKSSCDEEAKHYTEDDTKQNGTYVYCVDVCLCSVYRKQILKHIRLGNVKRAYRLTFAGTKRMFRDIQEQGFLEWAKGSIGI